MKNFEVNKENRVEEFEEALCRIKKDFISDNCRSNRPLFILAGGQPGSGKTAMIETIKENNRLTNFVVIDLDVFRQYHPDFEEIKRYHKKDGVKLTNSFAFQIEDEMLRYVIANSINTINVTSLRNTGLIMKNIKENIIPKGFDVKTYVMAVSPEESYYSTLIRYNEQQLNSNMIVRFTSKKFHDEAYRGMNKTLIAIQKENIAIIVCKRAPKKDKPPIIVFNSEKNNYTNLGTELATSLLTNRKESYERVKEIIKQGNLNLFDDEAYAIEDFQKLLNQIKEKEKC